ncbi:hypothetical protein [Bacillus sp. 1NLA3E]|uniref:hypothetical protein n=1 Tax=Bacillus sp. 1NLA3E TaxID=666686 RepID=UPI000247F09D|nr:hypothetical protein [Bacillus sp. 1NLA3E]AGK52794.1 hypothetical protein B1NLA3E_05120 [Bacillus sp. 1NLA3E]
MFWKKIEGINLWKVNRVFNKLALSKANLKQKVNNGVVVIPLEPKKVRELTTSSAKRKIEEKVRETEGFEVFRICLLEDCDPIYKEQLTLFGVSRWLEIPLKYT